MTWIDIVLIIILTGLIIRGLIIGLARSVFDIVGIIAGGILAIQYSPMLKIPKLLAIPIIFVVVFVVVSILGKIASKIIHLTPLGFIDRLCGGILGFVKGFILCFVFLIILFLIKKENVTLYRSSIAPWILRTGLTASQVLPRTWHQWIKKTVTHGKLAHYYEDYYVSL